MSTRWIVVGILLLATVTRLYQFSAPLLDQMFVKQVFGANKARAIAGPPFDPLCNTFDFLDADGRRMQLHEEIPLHGSLLGGSYWLFGEHDWLGRMGSILATLVALLAFYGLTRREFDRRLAAVATLLLATAPLLIFYGRAVLPDPAMLASMLVAAWAYRRYLDGEGYRWLLAAGVAGLLAGAFKYYGLIVVIPLAEMTWRKHGWRGWIRWDYLSLAAAMALPVVIWVGVVFATGPNPTKATEYFHLGSTPAHETHYFLFQQPELAVQGVLYKRFIDRFLYKDCGPVMAVLIAAGLWAAWARGTQVRPLLSWTVMGLVFYFLFGPKLHRHDYYELIMLPAAAMWAGVGWLALWESDSGVFAAWRYRAVAGGLILALAVVIHSPWVMGGKFRLESGQLILAERLRELTPPGGRVLMIGPEWTQPAVHYSGREGWALYEEKLESAWVDRLKRYRALGAEYVVVYFAPWNTPAMRESYMEMIRALTILEHHTISSPKGTSEFYILILPA